MNSKMIMFQRRAKANVQQAFSLVEVVLAIGVTSFALLGMVALLPIGLKNSHQASDAMTQAQIVQYARNELELTPFTNLPSWNSSTPLYFDSQGLPTTASSTTQPYLYSVTFTVSNVQMSTNSGAAATAALGVNANAPNGAADADLVLVNIVNRTIPGTSGSNAFPIVVPNAGF
jgi:uncharacterized protein (TIGR02598 family)